MILDPTFKPSLRRLEVVPVQRGDGMAVAVRDPSGLSDVMLSMSAPALQLLALMDGSNTLDEVRRKFRQSVGVPVAVETVTKLVEHLEQAHFLDGSTFDSYYESLVEAYRKGGVRAMPHAAQLGLTGDAGDLFEEMLSEATDGEQNVGGTVRGLVAPHLDYPRGRPCYGAAYAALRDQRAPDRVVILGTNHFGRSTAVVATGNDFETPLGRTSVDSRFLEALEERCGDLRRFELDHAREHSVELQVGFLQHLFGPEVFAIVPILCPDPCRPTGTAPADGEGVGLNAFAEVLGELIADDDSTTLVVAGADMSHVGAFFGDERRLDDKHLDEVRVRDRRALDRLERNDAGAFVRCIAEDDNATRVCSAGCLFALRASLPDARVHVLRYHQAVDQETQCCVTCAAVVFT